MKCHYCKRNIYPEEKTATIQTFIDDWESDKRVICQNCAEKLNLLAYTPREEGKNG
jgi:hypothetical protein